MSQIKRVSISLRLPSNLTEAPSTPGTEYEVLWGRITAAAIALFGIIISILWLVFAGEPELSDSLVQPNSLASAQADSASKKVAGDNDLLSALVAESPPSKPQEQEFALTQVSSPPNERNKTASLPQATVADSSSEITTVDVESTFEETISRNPEKPTIIEAPFLVEVAMGEEGYLLDEPEDIFQPAHTRSFSPRVTELKFSLNNDERHSEEGFPSRISLASGELVTVRFSSRYKKLKNQWVFHEWYLDNKLVAQIRAKPSTDNTEAYSTKNIDYSQIGRWDVKIVNINNSLLAEGNFSVNPEKQVTVNVE